MLVCYGVLLLAADGNGPFPPVRRRSASDPPTGKRGNYHDGNGATPTNDE